MADDLKPELKLSQQLVMTPQLQLAIKLLGTPTRDLPALIEPQVAAYGAALAPLRPGEPDPLIEAMAETYADDGVDAWAPRDDSPFPRATPHAPTGGLYVPIAIELGDPAPAIDTRADVWIFGQPPQARANGRAFPRYRLVDASAREAAWLLRALFQRARTYERVVAAVLALRPALATGGPFAPVSKRDVGEAVGMHESTIGRVFAAVRFATADAVFGFAGDKAGRAFRAELIPA
jgi:sigma-54-like protein